MASLTRPTTSVSDMDLASKTREKLAVTRTGNATNLRRVVLLCNTYDTFQQRLTEHFCISRSQSMAAARDDKLHVSCWEVAVVDEDCEEEEMQDDSDSNSNSAVQQPLAMADDVEPPPYEVHAPPRHPGRVAPQVPANVVAGPDAEDGEEPKASTNPLDDGDDLRNEDDHTTAPAYKVAARDSPLALKQGPKVENLHIENVSGINPPAPPMPRKAKLGRPGLLSRASFGHRIVAIPTQPGHGALEVH